MSVVKDENGKTHFDLRTHIRDPKTGFVTKKQPYRLVISRDEGEYFVRTNVRYYRDGTLVDKPVPAPIVPHTSGTAAVDPRKGSA